LHDKDTALYSKFLLISKVFPDLEIVFSLLIFFAEADKIQHGCVMQVLTYLIFLMWFWSVPVASISQQLVQPFGNAIMINT